VCVCIQEHACGVLSTVDCKAAESRGRTMTWLSDSLVREAAKQVSKTHSKFICEAFVILKRSLVEGVRSTKRHAAIKLNSSRCVLLLYILAAPLPQSDNAPCLHVACLAVSVEPCHKPDTWEDVNF
jgi:hypothetical protein